MKTASLASLILGCSLLLPSCLVGSRRDIDTTGTFIGEETFSRVHPGQSSEFVLELFGEPQKRIDTGEEGVELWKWSYAKEVRDSGSVFLLVNSKTTTRSDGAVFVELKDGTVSKLWRD